MVNMNIKDFGFGSRPKEVDDEYRARARGVKKRRWTKEKCLIELEDCLEVLKAILKDAKKINSKDPKKLKQETVKDMTSMMNRVLDYMRYLYPPIQQNLNVNVEMSSSAVIERLKNWKQEQRLKLAEEEDD